MEGIGSVLGKQEEMRRASAVHYRVALWIMRRVECNEKHVYT